MTTVVVKLWMLCCLVAVKPSASFLGVVSKNYAGDRYRRRRSLRLAEAAEPLLLPFIWLQGGVYVELVPAASPHAAPLRLLVDTGAASTIVRRPYSGGRGGGEGVGVGDGDIVHLQSRPPTPPSPVAAGGGGSGGRQEQAAVTATPTATPTATVAHVRAQVAGAGVGFPEGVGGVLGLDFLRGFATVEFDFDARVLRLHQGGSPCYATVLSSSSSSSTSSPSSSPPPACSFPVRFERIGLGFELLFADLELQGTRTAAEADDRGKGEGARAAAVCRGLVDTGSPVTIVTPEAQAAAGLEPAAAGRATAAAAEDEDEKERDQDIVTTGVDGRPTRLQAVLCGLARLRGPDGGVSREGLTVYAGNVPLMAAVGWGGQAAALVGLDLLSTTARRGHSHGGGGGPAASSERARGRFVLDFASGQGFVLEDAAAAAASAAAAAEVAAAEVAAMDLPAIASELTALGISLDGPAPGTYPDRPELEARLLCARGFTKAVNGPFFGDQSDSSSSRSGSSDDDDQDTAEAAASSKVGRKGSRWVDAAEGPGLEEEEEEEGGGGGGGGGGGRGGGGGGRRRRRAGTMGDDEGPSSRKPSGVASRMLEEPIGAMRVAALKAELRARGVLTAGFLEKAELVAALAAARRQDP